MKLNKKLVKKGVKNQVVSIGHMIIFNITSFILFMISNIGIKSIGNVSSSFFAIEAYEANLCFVIVSWILFLISFSIFYTKFFKKDLKKQLEVHWLFVVIFAVVSVIFCFTEIMLLVISLILNIGIFSTIVNFPDIIYVFILAYIIGYIVIDILKEINKKIRIPEKKRMNNKLLYIRDYQLRLD